MSKPHHHDETPEDELYDLLTCHRDDPRYLLIGNFQCFFSSGVPLFVYDQLMVDCFNILVFQYDLFFNMDGPIFVSPRIALPHFLGTILFDQILLQHRW